MVAPQEVKSFIRMGHLAGEFIARIFLRWSEAWREALASALGAALSWLLAERLLGHPQPIFAAISAIVCLSPGLPSHTKQTGGLLLGVATGIVIGELSLALPDHISLLRITLAAFFFDDCRSFVRPASSGPHPGRSVRNTDCSVRPGHHWIRSNGRCGCRCGCRFLVQPSSGFDFSLALKDVRLALSEAEAAGVPHALGRCRTRPAHYRGGARTCGARLVGPCPRRRGGGWARE
jgi:Fusaric acid resistance protein-like